MCDAEAFRSSAQTQLAKSILVALGVAAVLWFRSDLAVFMVAGWLVVGVVTDFRSYRSALGVIASLSRRRAEIEVTTVNLPARRGGET
jgi:hypothetical protein